MDIAKIFAERTIEVGDCLEWQGRMIGGRKGAPNTPVIQQTVGGKSVHTIVARWAWARENRQSVPEGLMVYRTCCNNRCVRGKHLAAGTLADIKAARKAAGQTKHLLSTRAAIQRGARRRSTTRHTEAQAQVVREMLAAQHSTSEIAAAAGVTVDMVKDIRRGKAWREQARGASVFTLGSV